MAAVYAFRQRVFWTGVYAQCVHAMASWYVELTLQEPAATVPVFRVEMAVRVTVVTVTSRVRVAQGSLDRAVKPVRTHLVFNGSLDRAVKPVRTHSKNTLHHT